MEMGIEKRMRRGTVHAIHYGSTTTVEVLVENGNQTGSLAVGRSSSLEEAMKKKSAGLRLPSGFWGALRPATKLKPSGKIYSRKGKKQVAAC